MTPRRDDELEPERRRKWDKVDQAGWESFPASDAPAYSPPGDTPIEPPEERPAFPPSKRERPQGGQRRKDAGSK